MIVDITHYMCSVSDDAGSRDGSRLPAGPIRLLKQSVDVADGEQYISCCEDSQPRDDITLPEYDKWLQGILQRHSMITTADSADVLCDLDTAARKATDFGRTQTYKS